MSSYPHLAVNLISEPSPASSSAAAKIRANIASSHHVFGEIHHLRGVHMIVVELAPSVLEKLEVQRAIEEARAKTVRIGDFIICQNVVQYCVL